MISINKILFFLFLLFFNLCNIKIAIFKKNEKNKLYLLNEYLKIYSILFFTAKEGKALRPSNNNIINNYSNIKRKGICLCTIGKNENLYARDFVEYYKLLGFDKIIIFDNNDLEGERFEDVLLEYINANFVTIIDIRGIEAAQLATDNYCYQKNKDIFDWIAFFDFDEYLFINESKTINNYI